MVDFAVALAMLAVLMAVYRVPPGWPVLLLPLWMALLLLLAMGIGLCTAALAVSYRDVQYILPVFTQILLYASPVACSLSFSMTKLTPKLRPFYLLHALAAPLEAFRWSLLNTRPPAMFPVATAAGASLAVFAVGAFSFKRMERRFADVI